MVQQMGRVVLSGKNVVDVVTKFVVGDDKNGNGIHCALNGNNHGLKIWERVDLLDDPFADMHTAGEVSAERPSELV